MVKAVLVGYVVNEGAAVSAPVELVPEGLELFLAGGIPHLECHHFLVDEDFFLEKISADSRLGLLGHLSADVLVEEGGLADVRVAEDHDLYKTLVFLHD